MNYISKFSCIIWLTIATSCSTQKQFVQTDLYFGSSQPDGEIIADTAWKRFVDSNIAKVFPQGFTEIPVTGKWLDTNSKEMINEPSRIIAIVYKNNKAFSKRIDSLRNEYKKLFLQQSVLRVDKKVGIYF